MSECSQNREGDFHYWVENSGIGGEPKFIVNQQMSREPVMHARCSYCGARTWFTEKQWLEVWGIGPIKT